MAEKYKVKQASGLFPEPQQKLEAFDTFSAEQASGLFPINKVKQASDLFPEPQQKLEAL